MIQRYTKNYFFVLMLLSGLFIHGCSDSSTSPNVDNNGGNDFSFTLSPGSSARAFLTANTFTRLKIEVDYMPGQKPRQEALDDLKDFLKSHLHKKSIKIGEVSQIPSGGQDTYSTDDAYDIEKKQRDHYQSGNTIWAYYIILDGKNKNDDKVLGATYFNTSVAIFGKTIQQVSDDGLGSPSREKIEGTVLEHEFGHMLGLVGNGTPLQSDHKTKDSPHCTTDGCLMNPSVNTMNYFQNIFDNSIRTLDSLCVEDLQANGGK